MGDRSKDFVIENPTLIRDQIYARIRQEILSGSITSGSQVLEGRMAKQFKVSRTPVREALHALEMEGFVESFPRVGYRVREISWAEVMEIFRFLTNPDDQCTRFLPGGEGFPNSIQGEE